MSDYTTNFSDLDLNRLYSYADYLTWRFEQRVELIRGKIFRMSPAPSVRHQQVSMALTHQLLVLVGQRNCQLFAAPFDVRLPDSHKSAQSAQEIYTVVQPDLCVICDRDKLEAQGAIGAPDLVVEILSPGNSKKEMKIKYALYEESGVREYWIVYPSEYVLQQFVLEAGGRYALKNSFTEDEVFSAHIFPDLQIDLAEVFAE
jgi:Uma2 family endonuclease